MSLTLHAAVAKPVIRKKAGSLTLAGIPPYIFAVSFAALFIIVGLIWDISWHMTIGRDKLLSPPHMLIYVGAIFGGLFSGIQVLWNTFQAGPLTQQKLIKVWGFFYSSLGAMFCIWGAIAMLTSAPFDDWWHNTYGLDVVILSPPHTVLAMGMLFLMFGACVSISKYLNLLPASGHLPGKGSLQLSVLKTLFVIAAASLLCMSCTLLTEYMSTRDQHHSLFYKVAAVSVLLFLPALSRALRVKWGMTAITLGYFLILAGSNWVLQQFAAEPKLGPILNPVSFFQPLQFPVFFVVPALAMDLIMQRSAADDWTKAALLSLTFVALLFAVQYPLSRFLLESPMARNKFFGSSSWTYGSDPAFAYRYQFRPAEQQAWPALLAGLLVAVCAGFVSARVSLRWGNWMTSIVR